MSARTERILPFFIAALATGIAALIIIPTNTKSINLYLTPTTLLIGLIPPVLAAIHRNTLAQIRNSNVIKHAIRTGYYHDLIAYLSHPVYPGIAAAFLSILPLILQYPPVIAQLWLIAMTFLITLIISLILRNEILMSRILDHLSENQDEDRRTTL